MTTAIRSLISKELQQHRSLLLWVTGFSLFITWLLFRIYDAGGGGLSYLTITSFFASPVLVIIAFVIGQRLVAAEYYGQTQRFIESLPISRGYVHWVKYWFGFLALLLILTLVWGTFVAAAAGSEPVSGQFIGLMFMRMCAFVFCMWSVVFTFSLLGRLRVPLIAGAAFVALLINNLTEFELHRFGPMALMDKDLFAFERATVPLRNLLETLVSGAIILALGMWMAGARDGSVMETLATPVTTRAKGFLIALGLAAIGFSSYFGPEPEAAAFSYSSPYVVSDSNVEVAYLAPEYEADALRLLQYMVERSEALDEVLPPTRAGSQIRVSLDPSLVATTFDTQMADPIQGTNVSANFASSSGWDVDFFGAYVFHNVVGARKDGRLYLEPHHWLLDGFTRWWAAFGDHSSDAVDSSIDPIMLKALHVTRNASIDAALLLNWDTTAELYGDTGAMTVAYSGFRVMQEQLGTAAALSFARQEFSRPTYGDIRDWWSDWRDPLPARFSRATGWSLSEFVDVWDRRMSELRESPIYRMELDAIAKGVLTIEPEISDQGARSLRYSLNLDQPLPANTRCVALHTRLPSYDINVGRAMLREAEVLWPEPDDTTDGLSVDYILAGEYGQGTRLFAAFECQFPDFSTPLYLGSVRLTMP